MLKFKKIVLKWKLMNRRELHRRELGAIKTAVILGLEFQKEHGKEAACKFREMSLAKLAEYYGNDGLRFIESLAIREHAIRYALCGNDNELGGPVYSGEIPREEYKGIVKRHKKEGGEAWGKYVAEQKIGACGLSHQDLSNASRNSAIARGQVPWDDGEKWFAICLNQEGIRNAKIAAILNEHVHKKEPVRNYITVGEMFRREKRRLQIESFTSPIVL